MKYDIHINKDGSIIGWSSGCAKLVTNEIVIQTDEPKDPELDYYSFPLRQFLKRSVIPVFASKLELLSNNADEVVFSGIPDNATCTHDGTVHEVGNNILFFTAEHPGSYKFKFSCFPYLDKTITLTAKDPS